MDMEYLDSNILHKLVFPFFFVGGNIVAPQICTPRMNTPPKKKNGGGKPKRMARIGRDAGETLWVTRNITSFKEAT